MFLSINRYLSHSLYLGLITWEVLQMDIHHSRFHIITGKQAICPFCFGHLNLFYVPENQRVGDSALFSPALA